ncbi:MAG: flagellar biosynthesis protein FlgB [Rhodobacteraceae bacterium CG17_big_fil_post_rev_8_21_14_2_50_63_15]|nr:FlgB family protein [Roseovarius sp.]PIV77343.1 MAG: flagellar biosynthesis protein FlgB [Rhodobacteraceae bacterium CG17_big_fil_post_rev_8_21_14_2_50_63_15]
MFEKLEIFRMAQAMAMHAGARQSVVAQNMANADTPGYRAQDIESFQTFYQTHSASHSTHTTRTGHLLDDRTQPGLVLIDDPIAVADPNGNSVSLESEMLKAVDIKNQHDRALAIYKSSLDVLRLVVSRR